MEEELAEQMEQLQQTLQITKHHGDLQVVEVKVEVEQHLA
jgi:hypothetical protein